MFLASPCVCKVIMKDAYFPFGMVPESVEKTSTYSLASFCRTKMR